MRNYNLGDYTKKVLFFRDLHHKFLVVYICSEMLNNGIVLDELFTH